LELKIVLLRFRALALTDGVIPSSTDHADACSNGNGFGENQIMMMRRQLENEFDKKPQPH
jgi:hypothetical protein